MSKPVAFEFGFTEQKVMKSSYVWKIKNFSYIKMVPGGKLESPAFTLTSDDKTIDWYLALYPFGISESYKHCISASLGNKSKLPEKFSMDVSFSISVLDRKGQIAHKKSKKSVMDSNLFDGFNEFLEKDILTAENSNMLINDVLTIFCEFTVVEGIVNYSMQEYRKCAPNTVPKRKVIVLDDIERQFEADRFHDFTITAPCGTELHVHKFMLAARSPVFRAMFTTDMKEKANSAVKIEDITYDALKEMIQFMYTGKVGNLDTCKIGVLMAAEKYQINGLKDECRDYLYDNLSIDNAVETLTFCHRFKINDLKALTCRFIAFHAKEIVNTEAFKSIDDPDVLVEVVQLLTLES